MQKQTKATMPQSLTLTQSPAHLPSLRMISAFLLVRLAQARTLQQMSSNQSNPKEQTGGSNTGNVKQGNGWLGIDPPFAHSHIGTIAKEGKA